MVRCERFHVTNKAVPDLREQPRRWDRVPTMRRQEPHDLTAHLQPRHVDVQQHPVNAGHLQRHMPIQHVIDVRHRCHHAIVTGQGRLCRPETNATRTDPEGAGGRARPPPANEWAANLGKFRRIHRLGESGPRSKPGTCRSAPAA